MTVLELLQNQLHYEAAITDKFIEKVPYDKLDWKPHPKSMSLGTLLGHIVEIPSWFLPTMETDELDMATFPYVPLIAEDKAQISALHKEMVEKGLKAFDSKYEPLINNAWTMREGDNIFFTTTKIECLVQCMSQIPHHRAQLGVYLRLLDIPVPSSYGPSADDLEMMT